VVVADAAKLAHDAIVAAVHRRRRRRRLPAVPTVNIVLTYAGIGSLILYQLLLLHRPLEHYALTDCSVFVQFCPLWCCCVMAQRAKIRPCSESGTYVMSNGQRLCVRLR